MASGMTYRLTLTIFLWKNWVLSIDKIEGKIKRNRKLFLKAWQIENENCESQIILYLFPGPELNYMSLS